MPKLFLPDDLAQVVQGLVQALACPAFAALGPEETCQRFSAVGMPGFNDKVRQEQAHLVRFKTGDRLTIQPGFEATKKFYFEYSHPPLF